jgi:hypothetical protein
LDHTPCPIRSSRLTGHGSRVRASGESGRDELLALFSAQVYGRTPAQANAVRGRLRYQVSAREPRALDGMATREEITVRLTSRAGWADDEVTPLSAQKPIGVEWQRATPPGLSGSELQRKSGRHE